MWAIHYITIGLLIQGFLIENYRSQIAAELKRCIYNFMLVKPKLEKEGLVKATFLLKR